MKKYKISKIGKNEENPLANYSHFGDSQNFFEGYSIKPPTLGERFILRTGKLGDVVINTSPIVELPKDGVMKTLYSVYKIEEL